MFQDTLLLLIFLFTLCLFSSVYHSYFDELEFCDLIDPFFFEACILSISLADSHIVFASLTSLVCSSDVTH